MQDLEQNRAGLLQPPVSRRVMNLAGFLAQAAARHPDEPALIIDDAATSWRQLQARVVALAALLRQAGVGSGDRVLLHTPNCRELIEVMLATMHIGAVWVPTNYRLTAEEVQWLAHSAAVRAYICHADYPEHLALAAAMPGLRFFATIGAGAGAPDLRAQIDQELAVGAARHDPAPAPVQYDHACWFFYTSGTTGRPKAAVLTHGQMAFVITNHLADLMPGTNWQSRSLVVAPLSHGAGIHFLVQLARGAASVFYTDHGFDPARLWQAIERYRVNNFFAVPTIVKRLVESPAVDSFDHSSLRQIIYAGAPMYRVDQQLALQKLGNVLVQYFGLGEVTGNITVLPPEDHHPEDAAMARVGSCGYARTGMQISIQDEAGRELGAGEHGEICVCGPAVFAGYFNNPEANAKAFRDGWFRTGDLGYLDANGYLYITGRESDMYISGGSNIYPRELEEKILAAGLLQEVCVLGIPDPEWGEVGVMVGVLKPGAEWDEAEFRAWLDQHIARYKHPRRFFIWPELPKSGYGKITKKIIYQHLQASL